MKKFRAVIVLLNFFFLILFSFAAPVSAADTLYFLHTDHLGSTRVVTDKTGTVVAQYDYWPYGSTKTETGSQTTERLYTSQISDESTDLYFYNARYYNPEIGNFISADVAGGSYLYVAGNPVNKVDPSGNQGIFTQFQRMATAFVNWMSVKDPAGQANLIRLANEGKYAEAFMIAEAQSAMNVAAVASLGAANSYLSDFAAAGPISSVPDVVNSRGQYDYAFRKPLPDFLRQQMQAAAEEGVDIRSATPKEIEVATAEMRKGAETGRKPRNLAQANVRGWVEGRKSIRINPDLANERTVGHELDHLARPATRSLDDFWQEEIDVKANDIVYWERVQFHAERVGDQSLMRYAGENIGSVQTGQSWFKGMLNRNIPTEWLPGEE